MIHDTENCCNIVSALVPDTNNNASSTARCLFGVSDPAVTDKLIQEQYRENRQRFMERFGVDIENIENLELMEVSDRKITTATTKRTTGHQAPLHARVFKPYNRNQLRITDLLRERKSAASTPVLKKLVPVNLTRHQDADRN